MWYARCARPPPQCGHAGTGKVVCMDVVGVDVVARLQHRRALEQARLGVPPSPVRRVNARNAQNAGAHPCAAQVAHSGFGIHTALGTWGSRRHGARFAHQRPRAIAIHPTGRCIRQRYWQIAHAQRADQCQRARIAPPRVAPTPFARRRGQVRHPRSQPGQAAQRGRLVQVSQKRRDRHPAQSRLAFWAGGQGHHPARGRHPRPAHSCGPRACLHRRNPQSTTARGGNARARRPSHWTKPRYSMNSFGQTSEDDGCCSGAGRSSARKARVATTSSPCQGNVGQIGHLSRPSVSEGKSAPFAQNPKDTHNMTRPEDSGAAPFQISCSPQRAQLPKPGRLNHSGCRHSQRRGPALRLQGRCLRLLQVQEAAAAQSPTQTIRPRH